MSIKNVISMVLSVVFSLALLSPLLFLASCTVNNDDQVQVLDEPAEDLEADSDILDEDSDADTLVKQNQEESDSTDDQQKPTLVEVIQKSDKKKSSLPPPPSPN